MGRGRKSGQRTKSGRLSRAKASLLERNPPAEHVIERRALFSFLTPEKGGTIDQDICDGIGQLHALGFLDGHGLDAKDLRDAGRFFGEQYWKRYSDTAPRTGKYERTDKSESPYLGETAADRRFDRMDDVLRGFERMCLVDLVVNSYWDDGLTDWASRLIAEGLRERGRIVSGFPTMEDRAMLDACIRALCAIVDGGMELRRAA